MRDTSVAPKGKKVISEMTTILKSEAATMDGVEGVWGDTSVAQRDPLISPANRGHRPDVRPTGPDLCLEILECFTRVETSVMEAMNEARVKEGKRVGGRTEPIAQVTNLVDRSSRESGRYKYRPIDTKRGRSPFILHR